MIILISGHQGSGKTTLAKAFVSDINKNSHYCAINMTFAEPLYTIHDFCWGYLKDHGIEMPYKKDGYLLQLLGTEWGRNRVRDSLWVDILKAKIKKKRENAYYRHMNLIFVISDCRFRNEFDAFGEEAVKIRLICSRDVRKCRAEMWRETDNHPSETDLDGYAKDGQFDYYFNTEFKTPDEIIEELKTKLNIKTEQSANDLAF